MRAARMLRFTASGLLLGLVAACGSSHSGTAEAPGLHPVPTSSWEPGDLSLAAQISGTLQGGYVHGTFCLWLAAGQGKSPIVWPAGYHVRVHPLELLNSRNVAVARGGDHITFGGGESPVKPGRTCMLGERFAFYVMSNVAARH